MSDILCNTFFYTVYTIDIFWLKNYISMIYKWSTNHRILKETLIIANKRTISGNILPEIQRWYFDWIKIKLRHKDSSNLKKPKRYTVRGLELSWVKRRPFKIQQSVNVEQKKKAIMKYNYPPPSRCKCRTAVRRAANTPPKYECRTSENWF